MPSEKVERALAMRKPPNAYGSGDHGAAGPNAGGNHFHPGGDDPGLFMGASVLSMREGGFRGGAVSEPETLPRIHPMGIRVDGSEGTDGMTQDEPDGDEGHGMDAAHAKAGVQQGVMMHGAAGARGGHYHCMAEGCDYFSRDKGNMGRHAAAKHKHGMTGSAGADPSSSAQPSSAAPGSTAAAPSSTPNHGMLGGAMAEIRRRYTAAGTAGGMDTDAHYMGGSSSYVTGDARK